MLVARFEALADRIIARFRRPASALILAALAALALIAGSRTADPDLFARLAMGRLILNTGAVPTIDPFAFTPKKPIWIDHEWLSGLIFELCRVAAGEVGLMLIRVGVVLLSLFAWMMAIRSWNGDRSQRFAAALIFVVAVSGSAVVWASPIRAQVFTYLGLPVMFWIVGRWFKTRRGPVLLALPPIFALWANAHGGFTAGAGLLLLLAVGDLLDRGSIDRRLAAVTALTLLATGLSPYGSVAYWQFVLDAVTMPRPSISEWRAIPLGSLLSVPYHLWVAALLFGAFRQRADSDWWSRILVCSAAVFFGYRHERFVALMLIATTVAGLPFLLAAIDAVTRLIGRNRTAVLRRSAAVVFGPGLVLTALLALIFEGPRALSFRYSGYPVEAARWLRDCGSGGRLLVDFNNGGFALWQLYPKYQIALDGRYEELYPNETVALVGAAFHPQTEAGRRAIETVAPDYLLVPAVRSGEFSAVEGFEQTYQDHDYAILARDSAPCDGLKSEHAPLADRVW